MGNADLSDPVERVALNHQARAQFLSFSTYGSVMNTEYSTNTNYHSLQATLRCPGDSALKTDPVIGGDCRSLPVSHA